MSGPVSADVLPSEIEGMVAFLVPNILTVFQNSLALAVLRLLKNDFLLSRSIVRTRFLCCLYSCWSEELPVCFALWNRALLLRIACLMAWVTQGTLFSDVMVICGIYWLMTQRKQLFHLVQLKSMSSLSIASQLMSSRRELIASKSAWEYLHTRLGGILVCLLGDITEIFNSSPRWSEFARGGMVLQKFTCEGDETKIRSIKVHELLVTRVGSVTT